MSIIFAVASQVQSRSTTKWCTLGNVPYGYVIYNPGTATNHFEVTMMELSILLLRFCIAFLIVWGSSCCVTGKNFFRLFCATIVKIHLSILELLLYILTMKHLVKIFLYLLHSSVRFEASIVAGRAHSPYFLSTFLLRQQWRNVVHVCLSLLLSLNNGLPLKDT